MQLNFSITKRGIAVNTEQGNFSLDYSGKVWKQFPKESFVDNMALLSTITTPLISPVNKLQYNTSRPKFQSYFKKAVLKDLPASTDEYTQKVGKLSQKFQRTKFIFKDNKIKKPEFNTQTKERAVVPTSFGKDSLLTLAVCKELNLNPVSIYIDDTTSPNESRTKKQYLKKVGKRLNLDTEYISNSIENLNDFEFWNSQATCVGYAHMIPHFCFSSLPISHFYKAKYIIPGNQQNMNFIFQNKEGITTLPSYPQSTKGMLELNKIINQATKNKVNVCSVIEPLANIAVIKVLHTRYKEFAKFQTSCEALNTTKRSRWCHACQSCAEISLWMLANGLDPKSVNLSKNFFQKKHKENYYIFMRKHQKHIHSKEELEHQKLAFYLATKNGAKGYLIDKFKKLYAKELNEDHLINKYLKPFKPKTMPNKIAKQVMKIYNEELAT